jgi:anti-anti-sigma factor
MGDCTSRHDGATTFVRVVGEIDMSTRDELIRCIHQVIDQGAKEVALELSGVRFCDTSGLSGLLAAYRIAQAAACHLTITSMTTNIHNILV